MQEENLYDIMCATDVNLKVKHSCCIPQFYPSDKNCPEYFYDITEVCKMLGITSRTLRFYEEKGIIQSTRIGNSSRRYYNEDQLLLIKKILVLRMLGLSVKVIAEMQIKESDLKDAILLKRAEIYAHIDSRIKEINLLNEALSALESGKNIFKEDWQHPQGCKVQVIGIAQICTDAVVHGDDEILYKYLSPRMAEYMPREAYRAVRKDTLHPLGDYISIEKTTVDSKYTNKIHSFVGFSKLGLKITFVFYGEKIEGLWFNYYDNKKG